MSKVRFKTRIFEIVYLSLFCTFSIILFFILALQEYDKSFMRFLVLLIGVLILCIIFIISALVLYQYCEFIDGVFIFKCPLYVIKKVKVEDIVLYDRLSIYEKGTRMNIVYPVIRIYLSKPTSKIKYKYWCNKKSTYFHIYDKKDNYDKFIKIMNGKEKT